jgi:hypothetical protein
MKGGRRIGNEALPFKGKKGGKRLNLNIKALKGAGGGGSIIAILCLQKGNSMIRNGRRTRDEVDEMDGAIARSVTMWKMNNK